MTYIENRLIVVALLGTTMLMACTGSYGRLHERYGHDHDAAGRKLDTEQVTITERNRKGVTSIGDSTSVYLSEETLYPVDKFVYLPGDIRIPAAAVDACSMVCFGSRDRHVALVLGDAAAEVTVTDSDELRSWCWRNRIPVISARNRRLWVYKGKALPAPILENSYQTFDWKMRSSCSGY